MSCRRRSSARLKDLPNISFHMELQLIHSGIPDVLALRPGGDIFHAGRSATTSAISGKAVSHRATRHRQFDNTRSSARLKDLPNISFHMELQLIHSGIPDVLALRQVGACNSI
jgi:hypothetical protein